MIEIEDKIVSLDVFDTLFACDYAVCQGACCIEGDSGAPLEAGEADELRRYLEVVRPLLSPRALEVIEAQGVSYIDEEGDEVTSIVDGKDCVFTTYDGSGGCQCAFERVYYEGKTDFIKPISCQLYPIRLSRYRDFTAVNYHKWSLCKCALKRGRREGIPLYRFLEAPLKRAFGEAWYGQLEAAARLLEAERSSVASPRG